MGTNPYATSLMAFVFSTLPSLLILGLCTVHTFSPNVVVLSGMAIGSALLVGAITPLLGAPFFIAIIFPGRRTADAEM